MNEQDLRSIMFADSQDFREQLLEKTLRKARRGRQARRIGRGLVAICLLALALWWSLPRQANIQTPAASGVAIISTGHTSLELVTTSPEGLNIVGDDELLKLIPGETKLLVWHAPGEAELVIVGP